MRRKILIVVVSLVVVIVAALAFVVVNIEGLIEKNRDTIVAKAEEAVGRDIALGKIGVSIWGGIGVSLHDVALADDPAFSDIPFVSAKKLVVKAKFIPLLKKRFEVKNVELDEPVFRVLRAKDGRFNFASLSGDSEDSSGGGSAAPLAIAVVDIRDGVFEYQDAMSGMNITVTRIESEVTDLDLERPVAIRLRAAFLGEEQNIDLRAQFGPVGDPNALEEVPVSLTLDFGPIAAAELLELFPSETAPQVNGPLSLHIEAGDKWPGLTLRVGVNATDLSLTMDDGFEKAAGIPLEVSATVSENGEAAYEISDIALQFGAVHAKGAASILVGDAPVASFAVETDAVELSELSAWLPAIADNNMSGQATVAVKTQGVLPTESLSSPDSYQGRIVLSNVSARPPQMPKPLTGLNSTITFVGQTATMQQSQFLIGDSRFDLAATVQTMTPLMMSYQVESPAIALDDVRPANANAKKPEHLDGFSLQGSVVTKADELLVLGSFDSNGGSLANIDYQRLSGRFTARPPHFELENVIMNALDGRITAQGSYIMDDTAPTFDFVTQVEDINVVEVFDQLPSFSRDYLRGRASLDLRVNGTGSEWADIQNSIDGDGSAQLFNGEIVDVNVFKDIVDKLNVATGQSQWISQNVVNKYPNVFQNLDTAFKEFSSSFAIEAGTLQTRNINFRAEDYVMAARGGIGFDGAMIMDVTLTMDADLSADLIGDVDIMQYLTNSNGQIEIPFKLTGTLPDVKVRPDEEFVKNAVREAIKDQGRELFREGIKNLFGDKDD